MSSRSSLRSPLASGLHEFIKSQFHNSWNPSRGFPSNRWYRIGQRPIGISTNNLFPFFFSYLGAFDFSDYTFMLSTSTQYASPSSFPGMPSVISSANVTNWFIGWTHLMSFSIIEKKIGSRTVPLGTALLMFKCSLTIPLTTTLCFLSSKNLIIQLTTYGLIGNILS